MQFSVAAVRQLQLVERLLKTIALSDFFVFYQLFFFSEHYLFCIKQSSSVSENIKKFYELLMDLYIIGFLVCPSPISLLLSSIGFSLWKLRSNFCGSSSLSPQASRFSCTQWYTKLVETLEASSHGKRAGWSFEHIWLFVSPVYFSLQIT